MIRNYSCILLDVDGVLVDSVGYYVQLIRGVAETLGADTRLPNSFYRSKLGVEFGLWMVKIIPAENHDRMESLLEERNQDASNGSMFELIDGTKELLGDLRSAGMKIGLVSTKTRLAMDAMLNSNELMESVDFSICGDEVTNYKPNPEGVNRAIEFLGAKPEQVVFIGDSLHDAGAAQNAGISFIGVTTGVCSRVDWEKEKLVYVDSVRDLL